MVRQQQGSWSTLDKPFRRQPLRRYASRVDEREDLEKGPSRRKEDGASGSQLAEGCHAVGTLSAHFANAGKAGKVATSPWR